MSNELIIMAVGDVHVSRPDPCTIFEHVAPILREGDVVVGNLEGLNCDRGSPILGKIEVGSRHLRSAPHNAKGLVSGGFNAMVLANNHNMDYGPEGLLQNIALLDELKIAHAGGGRNLEEAHKPAILERNGTRVAILSYTSVFLPVGYAAEEDKPGLATIKVHTSYQAPENVLYQPGFPPLITTAPDSAEASRMVGDIEQVKRHADVVLVAFHWGVSSYGRLVGYQKELGRAAIDAGADLVMGAHTHALQGMEIYKDRLICYSTGNFVMDGVKALAHFGSDTMILKCHVKDKKIHKYSFIPVHTGDDWQPRILSAERAMEVMKGVEAASEEFGTVFAMDGGEVVIVGRKPGVPEGVRGVNIEPHRGLPVIVDTPLSLPYVTKKLKGILGKESHA